MSVGAVNKQTGDRIPTAGMPAIDSVLSGTSTNPVQNAIITAALGDKQDSTDNNLQTTAKTIVGAINEHEGDIGSLKSGLTNYENQNNLNLEVSNRKNLVKVTESSEVWQGVTFVNNNDGTITATGSNTGSNPIAYIIGTVSLVNGEKYTFTGCPSNGGTSSYHIDLRSSGTIYDNIIDEGSGYSFTARQNATVDVCIRIAGNYSIPEGGLTFSPMIRPAFITDSTFAPYIPSVESRIEAVESGLTNVLTDISANTHLNKDSNLDTLPLGWYGINLYEGSGTGTGTPSYNTVGILWHVKGASNSFLQYIFGYNYFACRIRSNTTDAWDAWKFGHNALPT